MIRLGFNQVSIYPNNGIIWENRGEIKFQGSARIGNASAISIGQYGTLILGNNFVANAGLKLICYNGINIKRDVLVGWDVKIVDTDFHAITKSDGHKTKGYGPIIINEGVWIASGVKIYKNVTIPSFCVVGADTILHKSPTCDEKSIISNEKVGYRISPGWRNMYDDMIKYF